MSCSRESREENAQVQQAEGVLLILPPLAPSYGKRLLTTFISENMSKQERVRAGHPNTF